MIGGNVSEKPEYRKLENIENYLPSLKLQAEFYSEILVHVYKNTQCNMPDDHDLNANRSENFAFHIAYLLS